MGAYRHSIEDRLSDISPEVLKVDLDNDLIIASKVPLLLPNASTLQAVLRQLLYRFPSPPRSPEDHLLGASFKDEKVRRDSYIPCF